jgi:hypothetical protein
MFGVVLTAAHQFREVYNTIQKNNLDTLKVVTAWGLPWDENCNRALVSYATPNLIVRTKAGDPSVYQASLHPVYHYVFDEIDPWYKARQDIYIEIGNEPNIRDSSNDYIYTYRWYLAETIQACRVRYPQAKIISTALQPDRDVEKWHHIFSEQSMNIYSMVDYIGVHAYDARSFDTPTQYHIQKMLRIFGTQKLFFTELGIANPDVKDRIAQYKRVAQHYPVVYYHYNSMKDMDGNYHAE